MKSKIIIFVLISTLLQGCYSYKSIDLKNLSLTEGKEYKINRDGNFFKAKLVDSNDTLIKIKIDGKEKQIPIAEIKEIKEKKFSILKTVGLVPIIYGGVTLVYILTALSRL
jgi:hypothetical protein